MVLLVRTPDNLTHQNQDGAGGRSLALSAREPRSPVGASVRQAWVRWITTCVASGRVTCPTAPGVSEEWGKGNMNDDQREELIRRLKQKEDAFRHPSGRASFFHRKSANTNSSITARNVQIFVIANNTLKRCCRVRCAALARSSRRLAQHADLWRQLAGREEPDLKPNETSNFAMPTAVAGVRLVYIDPPFATKREFWKSRSESIPGQSREGAWLYRVSPKA